MRAFLGAIAALFVVGCDVPPYTVGENATGSGVEPGDATSQDDATADAEADATADTTTPDTPPVDSGCVSSTACEGTPETPYCNASLGTCVACLDDGGCPAGRYCASDFTCKDGCRSDVDCAPTVADAGTDDASDASDGGETALHCDAVAHLCVGCLDDAQCKPGYVCGSGNVCTPGCTAEHACEGGEACCGGSCLDTQTDVANCGACGAACPAPAHGTATCTAGSCAIGKCDDGFANCAGGFADGCETNVDSDLASCGACGVACAPAHGAGSCDAGACRIVSCDPGWADCDGDPSNGCEQSLTTNTHCGACGFACAPPTGTGSCATGKCEIVSCPAGTADCNGFVGDGCEVDVTKDATNCGGCGKVCPSTSGTPACASGACTYSSCASGLGDCDGSGTCKTPIHDDVANCGACGKTCTVANGTPECTGTSCGIAACNAGFADCNKSATDGCEQSLKTTSSCGACGVTCNRTNATATCATGACAIGTCNAGFANCDGDDGNGCETDVRTSLGNCGACGNTCTLAHATATCTAGACAVASCSAGYADCDGSEANGCERVIGTATNACGTATSLVDGGGSTNVCGTKSTEVTQAVTTHGVTYYKVHLVRCDGGPCKSYDHMRARFVVTSPPGMAYDLRVYDGGSCSSLVGSSTSGVPGATETVTWIDGGCTTPKDFVIEVKYRSGEGCGEAKLQVTGAY